MFRKLTGLIIILMVSVGLAISIGGILFVHTVLGHPTALVEEQRQTVKDALATLSDVVDTASESLDTASDSLGTLQTITLRLTDVISNTYPAIEATDQLLASELPDRLLAIEETLPELESTADAIEQALIQARAFEAEIVSLGLVATPRIQYEPGTLAGDSIAQIENGLEGLPEQLRSVGPDIAQIEQELVVIEDAIVALNDLTEHVGQDLERLSGSVDEMDELITRVDGMTEDLSADVTPILDLVKPLATLFLVWLALSQLAPLYVGIQLLES